MLTFEASKPNRDALFTNAKGKEKNSKFVFTKHMVKGDMDFIIGMFNTEKRENVFYQRVVESISNRRKRKEEPSKATFNRFEINKREVIFKFAGDISRDNGFSR